MRFLVIIFLVFSTSQSLAKEVDSFPYCSGIGNESKSCEFKRAEHFLGSNAKKIDDQVELISSLLRTAMLTQDYKSLEPYIKFPFNFYITDFRGTERRKDAKGYTIAVNNLSEFTGHLLSLSQKHPNIFNTLSELPYSTFYIHEEMVRLIDSSSTFKLKINDNNLSINSADINIF